MEEASYTPPTLPRVRQYASGKSYHTNDARGLVDYLTTIGWRRYPPKAGNELCRLWRSDSLILMYLSETIVCGGKRPEIAHQALGELLETPAGQQLVLWPEGSAT